MTADNQGTSILNAVKNVLTSKIIVAPYAGRQDADRLADRAQRGGPDHRTRRRVRLLLRRAVGLITSDGAPQDSRDGDDATEFHQPGYTPNADPTLTLAFTAAEDNDLTRLMTIGKPDETGVYHVKDIIQDTKWFAYQETIYKFGRKRRRLGVIQITGNEPAQDTRGEVSGLSLTATWQLDPAVDGGNSRYLQSYAAA